MIRFSNSHELTFACASGALAFDGRGWPWEFPFRWLGLLDPKAFTVVAKTITVDPIVGNLSLLHPWTCVALLGEKDNNGKNQLGATNAVGLTNPGALHWVTKCYPRAKRKGYKIAASVMANSVREAEILADELRPLDLAYVEWNPSCPNVDHPHIPLVGIAAALSHCGHPLVAKLAKNQVEERFVKSIDPFVEAWHAINTIPWDDLYPNDKSPIEKYRHKKKGGVSGMQIHAEALRCVGLLKTMTLKPIIGGGGIFSLKDVNDFESSGVSAFSIGTCFMYYPWYPNKIVKEHKEMKLLQRWSFPTIG